MSLIDTSTAPVRSALLSRYASTLTGVELAVELSSPSSAEEQLSQVQDFIAKGLDAIIVDPVDDFAARAISEISSSAGVPLVFWGRTSSFVGELAERQTYVGANEYEAGALQAREVCRLLRENGTDETAEIALITGDPRSSAAQQRTEGARDALATNDCGFLNVSQQGPGNWLRADAYRLVQSWLMTGNDFDAIIANNDEMALGSIVALLEAGRFSDKIVVAGIDGSPDAIQAIRSGTLDVTVSDDLVEEVKTVLDSALAMARDGSVEQKVFVPSLLINSENVNEAQLAQ